MVMIEWDLPEDRTYESGLDRAVLYPMNNLGIPWNGLTKVSEKRSTTQEPLYYEGDRFDILTNPKDFAATISAYTYHDIMDVLTGSYFDGLGVQYNDVLFDNFFSLSYRTMVGGTSDYKVHVLFNLKAKPSDTTRATNSDRDTPMEFSWDVESVPQNVSGIRTPRLIFDTRRVSPETMSSVEDALYGSDIEDCNFIHFLELMDYLSQYR